jgi:hypothetical protein
LDWEVDLMISTVQFIMAPALTLGVALADPSGKHTQATVTSHRLLQHDLLVLVLVRERGISVYI